MLREFNDMNVMQIRCTDLTKFSGTGKLIQIREKLHNQDCEKFWQGTEIHCSSIEVLKGYHKESISQ